MRMCSWYFFRTFNSLRAIVYAISRKARFIGGGDGQREEEYNKLLNIFLRVKKKLIIACSK